MKTESPFTLMPLDNEGEYAITYYDGISGLELEKLGIEIIKQFLIFKAPDKFFEGIFDGRVVTAVKPETKLNPEAIISGSINYVETGRNMEIKLWLSPILGLRIDTKNLNPHVFVVIFKWAAGIPCFFTSPLVMRQ